VVVVVVSGAVGNAASGAYAVVGGVGAGAATRPELSTPAGAEKLALAGAGWSPRGTPHRSMAKASAKVITAV
jgi:hypothetical protein